MRVLTLLLAFGMILYMNKHMRTIYICVTMLSLAIFGILCAATVAGGLQSFNAAIYSGVARYMHPVLTRVMIVLSNLGDWYAYVPAACLLICIPRTRRIGGVALAAVAVSCILNYALKHTFAIDRPDVYRLIEVTGYSFPSGHAMNGAVFIGCIVVLTAPALRHVVAKVAVCAVGTAFVLAVGYSRVYLGVHNAGDVLAGYAAGVALICTAKLVLERSGKILVTGWFMC